MVPEAINRRRGIPGAPRPLLINLRETVRQLISASPSMHAGGSLEDHFEGTGYRVKAPSLRLVHAA